MAANSHATSAHGAHEQHVSLRAYWTVFAALIILTVITVGASRIDFGALNAIVAFGIASVKASLVLGYFMHLKYDNMMNRVIIGSSVFFLLILWFFCILDIVTRIPQGSTL